MDCIVHGFSKSWTQLSRCCFQPSLWFRIVYKLLDRVNYDLIFYIHLVICAFRIHSLRTFNRSREDFLIQEEKTLQVVVGKID